jgi:hypothetical protein
MTCVIFPAPTAPASSAATGIGTIRIVTAWTLVPHFSRKQKQESNMSELTIGARWRNSTRRVHVKRNTALLRVHCRRVPVQSVVPEHAIGASIDDRQS